MMSRNHLLFHLTRVLMEGQHVDIFLNHDALGQNGLDKLYEQRHVLLSLQFLSGIPKETFLEMDALSGKWERVLKEIMEACECKSSSYEAICQCIQENIKAFDTNIYERHSDFFNFYLSPKQFFKLTPLKTRLQEFFKENNIAMIADIVINELPWKVLHLPRRQWEDFVEWIFTRVEIDEFLVQMAGFKTSFDCSYQNEYVLTRIGVNAQVYRVENVICFLKLARTYKEYSMLELQLGSIEFDHFWMYHFMTHRMFQCKSFCHDKLKYSYSLCLPSGEVKKIEMYDPYVWYDCIELGFLFDETARIANESKTRKDSMIAVTMAMHDRLGKDSAMRVLGAEMVNMIFCML